MNAAGVILKRLLDKHPRRLQYGEAYSLMKYRNPITARVEWLWNSRDGVTPFSINDPLDTPESRGAGYGENAKPEDMAFKGSMMHVDWHEDSFTPNFVPLPGMRVFIDWMAIPEEERIRIETERRDRFIASLKPEDREANSPPPITAASVKGKEGEPYTMTVDESLAFGFHALASQNPFMPPPKPSGLIIPGRG